MVLLGGDLFHENKPSRRTVVRTMQILRKNCLGDEEVHLAVRSDTTTVSGVNYMDENHAVSLPVFVIHGNHDDPTGAAGLEALSALDILSEAALVTYFGKVESAKRIDVAPILLQKGASKIALYGLGNIRDELLYDTWCRQRKVHWQVPADSSGTEMNVAPSEDNVDDVIDDDLDDDEPGFVKNSKDVRDKANRWFNLFVLHQNRVTRGSSRGITDTLLPQWLDYVVWGHEHDSIPNLKLSKPPITQPGSTVATSLSAGEAKPKHCVLLEVYKGTLRHTAIPLRTVRRFEFGDIRLSKEDGLNPLKPECVADFLAGKVDQMIKRQEALFDVDKTSYFDGSAPIDGGGFQYPAHEWYKEQMVSTLRQPLARLRVEIGSGWDTLNAQRFGQQFVGRCACSAEILHFYRARRTATTRPFLSGTITGRADGDEDELTAREYAEELRDDIAGGMRDAAENCKIPKLVQYYLYHRKAGGTGLEFLEFDKLSHAVDEFVEKAEPQAIPNYVTAYMRDQKKQSIDEQGDGAWDEDAAKEKFQERAKQAANRMLLPDKERAANEDGDEDDDDPFERDGNEDGAPSPQRPDTEEIQDRLEQNLDDMHAMVSQNPRLAKLGKIAEANANANADSDDDEDDEPEYTAPRRGRGRGRGRGRARGRTASTTTSRRKKPPVAPRPPPSPEISPARLAPTRKKRQSSICFSKPESPLDSDDDIQDADDRAAEEATESAQPSTSSRARPRRVSTADTIEVDDDDILDIDEPEPAPSPAPARGRKRRATAQPASSSSRPRSRLRRESQSAGSLASTPVSSRSSGRSAFGARGRRRVTPTIDLDEDD